MLRERPRSPRQRIMAHVIPHVNSRQVLRLLASLRILPAPTPSPTCYWPAQRAFMDSEVNNFRERPIWRDREKSMNDQVHKEIEALRTQKTKALKVRYRELFGEEA